MYKRLMILAILPLLITCKKNRTFEKNKNSIIFVDEDFKVVNKLKAVELNKITDSLLFSGTLLVNNDYLFISEVKSNIFMHAINIPNDTYVGKFGSKGKGPGEVLAPWAFTKSEKGELRVFDPVQKKIVEFDIDSLLNNKGHNKEYRFPSGTNPRSSTIYKDRLFYMDMNNVKYRVFEKGVNDSIIVGHGTLLKKESGISDFNHAQMCHAQMGNYKGLFAFSYNSIPLVEIYDSGQDKWVSIIGPENYIPLFSEYKSRIHYTPTVKISDKYIYTLYNGKEYKGEIEAELTNIIYVFNHSGGLVKKLVLDKSIFTFDIYRDKFIYALTNEDNLFKLLKFEL